MKETEKVLLLLMADFFMSTVLAPKGAIFVFTCLSANLALQEFFQAINFHFTRTTGGPDVEYD